MKKLLPILILTLSLMTSLNTRAQVTHWTGTWATAPEYTGPSDMPVSTLSNHSLRQVVRVSVGGDVVRLKLSNEFGNSPVDIKSVYIALAGDSCEIQNKTVAFLKFNNRKDVTIAAGSAVYSDALKYKLSPLTRISITICYGEKVPQNATSHRGSRTYSYIAVGNVKPEQKFQVIEKLTHWYNIDALEIADDNKKAICILGNSITDGRGSTTGEQNRWPDFMATAMNGNVGVLNLGIGGNCVVEGGISEPGMKRFDRDVIGQQGIDRIIIFEGTNDIGLTKENYEGATQRIIEAYKAMIAKAHAKGLKVWGATITPTKGNNWFSLFHEAMRQTVNEWIRQKGNFDGVIDFDKLVRSQDDPEKLQAEYSDDWLHLNPAGYKVMGQFAADALNGK